MKTLPLILSVSLLTGCNILVTKDVIVLDHARRAPTVQVDVYKDSQHPSQKYLIIAEMSWLGPRSDELRAERYFLKESSQMGANAILFEIADSAHSRSTTGVGGPGGFIMDSHDNANYLFKAKAILYEP